MMNPNRNIIGYLPVKLLIIEESLVSVGETRVVSPTVVASPDVSTAVVLSTVVPSRTELEASTVVVSTKLKVDDGATGGGVSVTSGGESVEMVGVSGVFVDVLACLRIMRCQSCKLTPGPRLASGDSAIALL